VKRHIEFFDRDHFEDYYHRVKPDAGLDNFIDFFWETKFDQLPAKHPEEFSDVLFPNTGYTYLINLGTPFIMELGGRKFNMRSDGFLPRRQSMECFHRRGNILFGIKFKISPVIYHKKINFSEYADYIFPLSYLMDVKVIETVKKAASFRERVQLLNKYFREIIDSFSGSLRAADITQDILQYCDANNAFDTPVKELAARHGISMRTLQRYFESATGTNTKTALQIMRIRKAAAALALAPEQFNYRSYGYYDYSHFCRHLRSFFKKETLKGLQPHLHLLSKLHRQPH
jgi:AraC-like DNA-binding protein